MTANRILAYLRDIPEESCLEIDQIHEEVKKFMEESLRGLYTTTFIFNKFEEYEYRLQELWGFPLDPSYHKFYKDFKFLLEEVTIG